MDIVKVMSLLINSKSAPGFILGFRAHRYGAMCILKVVSKKKIVSATARVINNLIN